MTDKFLTLPLAFLSPDPHQPRRELENDNATVTEAHTLQGLANSIAEVGMLQPIRVRSSGHDQYTIVSGQRRYEAARMAGLAEVPCLINDDPADDAQTLVSQVSENLQRKAMTAGELAVAVQTLLKTGATQEQVARKLGIQPSQVTLLLSLLTLSGPVKSAFERGRIESPRAAYDLNKLPVQLQELLINEAERTGRVVTQRDVSEAKLIHANKLALVRHRIEVPPVSSDEFQSIQQCLDDGYQDRYDPREDRYAVFGLDWDESRSDQAEQIEEDEYDGVKAMEFRVRVPSITLSVDQVDRLYVALGKTPPDSTLSAKATGMKLAALLMGV